MTRRAWLCAAGPALLSYAALAPHFAPDQVFAMSNSPPSPQLLGRWWHAHEEPIPNGRIFRGEDYTFGPSRGRDWFEFSSDGTGLAGGPSADDRGQNQMMRWSLDDGVLIIETADRRFEFRVEYNENDNSWTFSNP